MTRHILPLTAVLTLLSGALLGCAHHPQITFVDRDYEDRHFSVPFKTGSTFSFPKVESHGSPYWVIFLDQTPCKLSDDKENAKAYKGVPDTPPTCTIAFESHGQDRLYRYTVYIADKNDDAKGAPELSIPYQRKYSCRPYCNGKN